MSLGDPDSALGDPTNFDGILPVIPPGTAAPSRRDPSSNAATGASAAGMRALTAQVVAFYFRAPIKAFFRTRVDYLAYARSISPDVRAGKWSWRATTPGLLINAVQTFGWRFIPEQVLPPLVANVAVGAVLYTSYLQILGRLHEPSAHAMRTVYPPPPPTDTFLAGFLAGGIQSLVAAPLDAIQVRFDKRETHHADKTMWQYGRSKLHEIGIRGIFAGWGLSFLKDSFGSGIFFATFEYVKAQGYYNFVKWYYGALGDVDVDRIKNKSGRGGIRENKQRKEITIIKPHYALEPAFLLLAGTAATVTQQSVLYPLTTVQMRHYERLEELDRQAKLLKREAAAAAATSLGKGNGQVSAARAADHASMARANTSPILSSSSTDNPRKGMFSAYYNAYTKTLDQCTTEARPFGGLRKWLYRGFWWNTVKQVPSTSAGLIMFELFRRKYGMMGDEVRISGRGKAGEEEYDILLH